jgi:hypothetical protein
VSQRLETDVRFECPICGKAAHTSVAVPEPHWGAAEKMSDLTSEDQTEVICSECGAAFPAYVYNSATGCDITLDDYPGTKVDADMAFFSPPDDEWIDRVIPDAPHDIFMDSYHHAGDILADHGGEDGSHLINRMVFAQQVTALEAYLGDTLLKAIGKQATMARLLAADRQLNAERFTLADIAASPHFVEEKVKAYLRKIIYHDLRKVDFLYNTALGVRVLSDKADNAKLLQAVKYRHDCVHRNGRDENGKQLTVFTKAYVREVADVMRSLVDRIEREIFDDKLPF